MLHLHTTELLAAADLLVNADDVESHCFGQWSALADGDSVADLQANPRRGAVRRRHRVALLVPVVLFDVVQVCTEHIAGQELRSPGGQAGIKSVRR